MGVEEGSGVIGEIYIGRVLLAASLVRVGLVCFLVMVGACLLLRLGWVLANCMYVYRGESGVGEPGGGVGTPSGFEDRFASGSADSDSKLELELGFLFLILVLWKGKRFLRLCTPKIATCADRFKIEGFSAAESGSGSATVDGLWRVANEPQGGGWESGFSYTESTLDSPRGLQSLGLCYSSR
jgi:hypothetical protein